jgi:hypothetical protein
MRYGPTTSIAAVSGLIAGVSFIGFEFIARSMNFFVVGQSRCRCTTAAVSTEELMVWNEFAQLIPCDVEEEPKLERRR